MQFTATIEPNEKYLAVIVGEDGVEEYEDEADYRRQHPAPEAADAYLETIADAPSDEEIEADWEDRDPLSWSMVNAASDPDLLAKMATYFDGVEPDEPADLIRAKLRLVDVDLYVSAQIAADAELRREQPATA